MVPWYQFMDVVSDLTTWSKTWEKKHWKTDSKSFEGKWYVIDAMCEDICGSECSPKDRSHSDVSQFFVLFNPGASQSPVSRTEILLAINKKGFSSLRQTWQYHSFVPKDLAGPDGAWLLVNMFAIFWIRRDNKGRFYWFFHATMHCQHYYL